MAMSSIVRSCSPENRSLMEKLCMKKGRLTNRANTWIMGAIVKLGNDWIIKVLISLHKFFQASWIESANWLHKQHQNMQKQVRQTNNIKRLMWNGLCSFMSQSCSMMMWGSSWKNVRFHLHGSFWCGCWKSAKCFSQCSLATIVWCKTNHSKNGKCWFPVWDHHTGDSKLNK